MERIMLWPSASGQMSKDRCQHLQRGFTLVELLGVVVIVSVLATLAVYGVRKYIFTAKSSEVYTMINAIRAAEEAFRDETFGYLAVSGAEYRLYPQETPGTVKAHWTNPSHSDYGRWQILGVDSQTAVQYGYAVNAGARGTAVADPPQTDHEFNWPASPADPWYVVLAAGDLDGDGKQSVFVASSFSSEIYVENEAE